MRALILVPVIVLLCALLVVEVALLVVQIRWYRGR